MSILAAINTITAILDLSVTRAPDIVGIIEPFKLLFRNGDKKAQIQVLEALRKQSARKLVIDLDYITQRQDMTASSVAAMLEGIKANLKEGPITEDIMNHLLTLQQIANDIASSRGAVGRMKVTVNELDDDSIKLPDEV